MAAFETLGKHIGRLGGFPKCFVLSSVARQPVSTELEAVSGPGLGGRGRVQKKPADSGYKTGFKEDDSFGVELTKLGSRSSKGADSHWIQQKTAPAVSCALF